MIEIGIVGLDTSHGEAFASTLAAHPDATLEAVWDGGDVRSDDYASRFAAEHDADRVDDPLELVDAVDAAMILTVDWDTHRELAVPFLRAGVPTMIDKPIAGSLADVREIQATANGTPVFGGSAVPYHSAIRSFSDDHDEQTFFCIGYDDPFYYGPHLVDTVCRIVEEPWTCVSPADSPGQTVDVVFADGTYATLRLDGPGARRQFSFLSIGNRTTTITVGSSEEDMADMYRGYVDEFLDVVEGRTDASERALDAAELLLGVHAALEYERPITPDCRVLSEFTVDGSQFLAEYSPYY